MLSQLLKENASDVGTSAVIFTTEEVVSEFFLRYAAAPLVGHSYTSE